MKYKFKKFAKPVTFICSHCKKTKTSKNVAISEDQNDQLCNGCYGELLSKNKIEKYD